MSAFVSGRLCKQSYLAKWGFKSILFLMLSTLSTFISGCLCKPWYLVDLIWAYLRTNAFCYPRAQDAILDKILVAVFSFEQPIQLSFIPPSCWYLIAIRPPSNLAVIQVSLGRFIQWLGCCYVGSCIFFALAQSPWDYISLWFLSPLRYPNLILVWPICAGLLVNLSCLNRSCRRWLVSYQRL